MHFSKCLRAKIYSNINVYFDALGCQTLLLKESEPLFFLWVYFDALACQTLLLKESEPLFILGSWTISFLPTLSYFDQAQQFVTVYSCSLELSVRKIIGDTIFVLHVH